MYTQLKNELDSLSQDNCSLILSTHPNPSQLLNKAYNLSLIPQINILENNGVVLKYNEVSFNANDINRILSQKESYNSSYELSINDVYCKLLSNNDFFTDEIFNICIFNAIKYQNIQALKELLNLKPITNNNFMKVEALNNCLKKYWNRGIFKILIEHTQTITDIQVSYIIKKVLDYYCGLYLDSSGMKIDSYYDEPPKKYITHRDFRYFLKKISKIGYRVPIDLAINICIIKFGKFIECFKEYFPGYDFHNLFKSLKLLKCVCECHTCDVDTRDIGCYCDYCDVSLIPKDIFKN